MTDDADKRRARRLKEAEAILTRLRIAASPMMAVADLADQRCIACGGADLEIGRYPAFKSAFFAGLILARCRTCGLGWVPVPDLDLESYYTHHYADEFRAERAWPGAFYGPDNPAWARPVHKGRDRARRHAGDLARFGPFGRVLDMGAGEGFFLHALEATEKYACEPDIYSRRILQDELDVTLQGLDDRQDFFDLVMASHVLEHFTYQNIAGALGDVRRALKPGGLFYIEVPTGAAQLQEFIAGRRPPKQRLEPHTLFFSSHALNRLLGAAGFELVETALCRWSADHLTAPMRAAAPGETPLRPQDDALDHAMVMIARRPAAR